MITNFKIFEKVENKKYMVYYDSSYYIDKFIEIKDIFLYYKNICRYSKSGKKYNNDNPNEVENVVYSHYIQKVEFTSDDLSECEKYIELKFNTEKYNL